MIDHTTEKNQTKYFTLNQLRKIIFFYVQAAALPSSCSRKLLLFKFRESGILFIILGTMILEYITLWTTPRQIEYII